MVTLHLENWSDLPPVLKLHFNTIEEAVEHTNQYETQLFKNHIVITDTTDGTRYNYKGEKLEK